MRKRITALLLAFVMTASLLPVTAQAVSPEAEAQAAVITTAAEFAAMAPDGNYRLEADITVDEPYGRTFTGSFDGAHHIITIDLHASAGEPVGAWGLFGELDGAAVKDLRLRGELTAAEDSGVRSLGALAGQFPATRLSAAAAVRRRCSRRCPAAAWAALWAASPAVR